MFAHDVRARAPAVPARADINAPTLNSKLTHLLIEGVLKTGRDLVEPLVQLRLRKPTPF